MMGNDSQLPAAPSGAALMVASAGAAGAPEGSQHQHFPQVDAWKPTLPG